MGGKRYSMKRVCCFCETWESGGIESFLCNVISNIDLSDIEIDIVASQLKKSVFTEVLTGLGVCFYELSGNQKNIIENYRCFKRILKRRKYDVFHLNAFQGMSLYYLYLAKRLGVSVRIAHSHNTDIRQSLTRRIKMCIHRWYSNHYTTYATELWACSKSAADFMFPIKMLNNMGYTFVPNGINTSKFKFDFSKRNTARKELGLSEKFVIGNVGRLCYQKNQSFLLDVLKEVLERKKDSILLLVGEGEDKLILQEKAKSLGIEEYVIFYGVTDTVEKLFCAMDVFAFPSLFEGLGIVAIEAQASGLPVIASEHVPDEANIIPIFQKVPLKKELWAEKILSTNSVENRMGLCNVIYKKGFDIKDVSTLIKKKFFNQKLC